MTLGAGMEIRIVRQLSERWRAVQAFINTNSSIDSKFGLFVTMTIFVALFSSIPSTYAAEIYLEDSVSPEQFWMGSCDVPDCTRASPCASSSSPMTITGTGNCAVTLLSQLPVISWQVQNNGSFTLFFETPTYDLTGALFNFQSGPASFYVSPSYPPSSMPLVMGPAQMVLGWSRGTSNHVTFEGLHLENVSFTIAADSTFPSNAVAVAVGTCNMTSSNLENPFFKIVASSASVTKASLAIDQSEITVTGSSPFIASGLIAAPQDAFLDVFLTYVTVVNTGASAFIYPVGTATLSLFRSSATFQVQAVFQASTQMLFLEIQDSSVSFANTARTTTSGQALLRFTGESQLKEAIFESASIEVRYGSASIYDSSLLFTSDTPISLQDASLFFLQTLPAATTTTRTVFDGARIEARSENCSISFAPSIDPIYEFMGSTIIEAFDFRGCSIVSPGPIKMWPDSSIQTSCDFSLTGGINGADGSKIESMGTMPNLITSADAQYDRVALHLTNFGLTVKINETMPSGVEYLRGVRLDVRGNASYVAIEWPSDGSVPGPAANVPYLLFYSTDVTQNETFASKMTTIPSYEFNIIREYPNKTFFVWSSDFPSLNPDEPSIGGSPSDNAPGTTSPSLNNPDLRPDYAPNAASPSSSCPEPPPGFECNQDGDWVSNGSVVLYRPLRVPAVTIIVNGNFSAPGSITFEGNKHPLIIRGCFIPNNTQITVDLSSGEWKDGKVTLIKQNEDCPSALNTIPVSVKQPKKGCKKVKSKIDSSSSKSTLSVLFSTDSSACNTKWIILGAVLGGCLIIAVVVTIVVLFVLKSKQNARFTAAIRG